MRQPVADLQQLALPNDVAATPTAQLVADLGLALQQAENFDDGARDGLLQRLSPTARQELFFDIETDPLRDLCYLRRPPGFE